MIEIILIVLAGLALIALIYVLIQCGLKIRQNRLKEKQEQRNLEHQNKLANGYKYYEWKGIITYIHRNIFDPGIIMRTSLEYKNGEGYFKSENDLSDWLLAQSIVLKWCREL